jgi:hypothetical protein
MHQSTGRQYAECLVRDFLGSSALTKSPSSTPMAKRAGDDTPGVSARAGLSDGPALLFRMPQSFANMSVAMVDHFFTFARNRQQLLSFNEESTHKRKMMTTSLLELEGTWEEIIAQMPDFSGQKLRLLVYSATGHGVEDRDTRPIPEVLAEIAAAIPVEELAQLPSDFTDQLDHYIYGTPKR